MRRALIAGADTAEISELARKAGHLFGDSCAFYALELDTSSVDPALAWGTAQPVVRRFSVAADDGAERFGEPEKAKSTGVRRPLGSDGDVAPTILDIAHDFAADVIVTAARSQGWFARMFSGSAARDLLDTSDIPVLMVNLGRCATPGEESTDGPSSATAQPE